METPLPDNPSASGSESSLGRCPACGYIVHGLPQPRCPECGEKFDPKLLVDDEVRAHLLAWERPELGGRPRRFVKTVFAACFKPWSHFDHARQRIDTPIAHAGQFIRWCLIVAVLCQVAGSVAEKAIFFGRNILSGSTAGRSLNLIVSTTKISWALELAVDVSMLLSTVLSLLLLGLLLIAMTEIRGVAMRRLDVLVLISPAAVIVQGMIVFSFLLISMGLYDPRVSIIVAIACRPGLFVLFGWLYCRRVLSLGRFKCVGLAVSFVILGTLADRLAGMSLRWMLMLLT